MRRSMACSPSHGESDQIDGAARSWVSRAASRMPSVLTTAAHAGDSVAAAISMPASRPSVR